MIRARFEETGTARLLDQRKLDAHGPQDQSKPDRAVARNRENRTDITSAPRHAWTCWARLADLSGMPRRPPVLDLAALRLGAGLYHGTTCAWGQPGAHEGGRVLPGGSAAGGD